MLIVKRNKKFINLYINNFILLRPENLYVI